MTGNTRGIAVTARLRDSGPSCREGLPRTNSETVDGNNHDFAVKSMLEAGKGFLNRSAGNSNEGEKCFIAGVFSRLWLIYKSADGDRALQ